MTTQYQHEFSPNAVVPRPGLAAPLLMVEAAIAWRADQPARARTLADQAAEAFTLARNAPGAALCRALAVHCGAPLAPGEPERLAEALQGASHGLRWQAVALCPALPFHADPPTEAPGRIREILAPSEPGRLPG